MSTAFHRESVSAPSVSIAHSSQRVKRSSRSTVYSEAMWVHHTLLVLASIATAVSCYLAWASLTSSPVAGCGGGSLVDCDHVLHSRWSSVLSVPVSVPAIGLYLVMIGLILTPAKSRRASWIRSTGIGIAALTASLAAIWFIGIQVFALQHLCPYCLVVHGCGVIAAVVYFGSRSVDRRAFRYIGSVGVGSIALLVVLQTTANKPQSYELIDYEAPAELDTIDASPTSDGELFQAPASASIPALDHHTNHLFSEVSLLLAAIHPGLMMHGQVTADGSKQESPEGESDRTATILKNIKLSTSQWPILGSPNAEVVFVEMFDYTCPHCQRTHQSLTSAKKEFGDRLAVIALPVPLDRKCNSTVRSTHSSHRESCEISKLAIAVWLTEPEEFEEFHDYLFTKRPRYAEALSHAREQVDESRLHEIMKSPAPEDYISKHVSLYRKAGSGTIPKLLFPNTTSVGSVTSPQAMVRLIKEHAE